MKNWGILHENWLPVVGYEGLYEVSDLGKIRSVSRINRNGVQIGGIVLRPGPQRKGYLTVSLIDKDGRKKSKRVHRLVLEAFVGPCPEGHLVRHLNDIPGDNRLGNLRWGTGSENQADARVNGRFKLNHSICHECGLYLRAVDDYYRSPATGLRTCVECRPNWREVA